MIILYKSRSRIHRRIFFRDLMLPTPTHRHADRHLTARHARCQSEQCVLQVICDHDRQFRQQVVCVSIANSRHLVKRSLLTGLSRFRKPQLWRIHSARDVEQNTWRIMFTNILREEQCQSQQFIWNVNFLSSMTDYNKRSLWKSEVEKDLQYTTVHLY